MTDDVQTLNFQSQNRPTVHAVVTREMTAWRGVEPLGKSDGGLTPMGSPVVTACMVEVEEQDNLGMTLRVTPCIKHRFWDQKQKKDDQDVAVSELSADSFLDQISDGVVVHRGQKPRFKGVIEDYERVLTKAGRDHPIVLLADRVYADLINTLRCHGITTIQAFAAIADDQLQAVKDHLRRDHRDQIISHLPLFIERAKEKLADMGVRTVETPKKSAKVA